MKPSHLFNSRFEAKQTVDDGMTLKGVLVLETGYAKGHYAVVLDGRACQYEYGNPEHDKAEKYPIKIDEQTLRQVADAGNSKPSVKAKLNHGESVGDIIGCYKHFRVEGNAVRADLTLMKSSPHKDYVLELADTLPDEIGNSIDFLPYYEVVNTTSPVSVVARCKKLNSVDIVDQPAATNSLFENPNPQYDMPLSPEDLKSLGDLIDNKMEAKFSALKQDTEKQFQALNKKLEEVEEKIEEELEETEEEKAERERKEKEQMENESEDKDKEFAARVEKAAMAAVNKMLPKASVMKLNEMSGKTTKDPFDDAVDLALSAGAPSRGIAIQRVAKDKPELFNQWAAKRSGKATL